MKRTLILTAVLILGVTAQAQIQKAVDLTINLSGSLPQDSLNAIHDTTAAKLNRTEATTMLAGKVDKNGDTTTSKFIKIIPGSGANKRKLAYIEEPQSPGYGLILYGDATDGVFKIYGVNNNVETTLPLFTINRATGVIGFPSIPADSTGLVTGDAYSLGGAVHIKY